MKPQLDEETSYRLYKLLGAEPDLSQRQLAERLGMSLGKVNYCVNALIAVGSIKVSKFMRSKHKFNYLYVMTPSGLWEKAQVTRKFLETKEAEYESLKQQIESIRREIESDQTGHGADGC